MITFAWPYLFSILPLPLFLKSKRGRLAALSVPDLGDFAPFQGFQLKREINFSLLLAILAWVLLVTAAARPQWVGDPVEIPQKGRDLMLAVDLSGSMMMTDFEIGGKAVDRLTALKGIAGDFIDRRKGDRLGLILFGSQAYLQTPLTFDTATVKQLLMEAQVGLAGKETAIGDAIAMSVKHLRDSRQDARVLVLLTDGNNNTGELTPEKAVELAENAGLKIHTVAIGADEMIVQSFLGARKIHPSAELDEKTLKMIAEKTGGTYFRAYDTQDLKRIYKEIDRIEVLEKEKKFYRPIKENYSVPLMASLSCLALLILIRRFR